MAGAPRKDAANHGVGYLWSRKAPYGMELTMTSLSIAEKRNCQLFSSGHNVHWIHARLVSERIRFRVTNLTVDNATGVVVFTAQGETQSLWTHNPAWIGELQNRHGVHRVYWCPSPSTLCVEIEPPADRHGWTSALFYLASEPTQCTEGSTPGHPIQEIRVRPGEAHLHD